MIDLLDLPTAECVIRHLRTVLDETQGLLSVAGGGEELLILGQSIERLRGEAATMAPNFPELTIRNGPAGG
jgi:hypothetical protein